MKPVEVLSEEEKQQLDYENVLDCHFVTPKPGKKENLIRAYCRRCKKLIKEFKQDAYDSKFIQPATAETSQSEQEMIQAWLEHECEGMGEGKYG